MAILTLQVSLYTLMLGERYGMQTSRGGLLFYLKGGHMQGLPTLPHEIRGLSYSTLNSCSSDLCYCDLCNDLASCFEHMVI